MWQCGAHRLELNRPIFLGILNLTPDSFSDGERHQSLEAAIQHAAALVEHGALILDLGAESTRPGAQELDIETEWQRLEGPLKAIRASFPQTLISIDTRHAECARRAIAAGASILNDVEGFSDPAMLDLARKSECGLIAMRSRKKDGKLFMPDYKGPGQTDALTVIHEMRALKQNLLNQGIQPERLVLDPGFGFGTTFEEDLAVWHELPQLPEALDWPKGRICIAISRKRFVALRAGCPTLPPQERDELTRAAHLEAQKWGYVLFRTHAAHPTH